MASESEWTTRVAAWRESGQSASVFCADKEYSASSLYYRAGQLKSRSVQRAQESRVSIARVVRKANAPIAVAPSIVVQLGDLRVEVSSGVERAALSELLDALANSPWGVRP